MAFIGGERVESDFQRLFTLHQWLPGMGDEMGTGWESFLSVFSSVSHFSEPANVRYLCGVGEKMESLFSLLSPGG